MKAPKFWSETSGLAGRAAGWALSPVGAAYSLAGWARSAMSRPFRPDIPVICIGNLTAGGAGKTPTVQALGERLRAMGIAPHVLTRGYGGRVKGPHLVDLSRDTAEHVGDEAALLARRLPVWVGGDRVASARAAVAAGAEILLMDDGFQNPSLAKDLSILVIDAGFGHGNGKVVPAGPLREPMKRGFARADAVVMIGEPPRGADWPFVPRTLPLLHARLTPQPTTPRLAGRKVVAFAGIGRPEKFFETLRHLGARVVETEPFPDHYAYASPMLARLEARAARLDALLVTTEKDAVRLPRDVAERCVVLPVSLGFEDPSALDRLLDRVLEPE